MRRITSVIARPMSGSTIGSAERDGDGAGDHGERDVGVGAGVIAVGDQRGAVEAAAGAGADLRGEPVAGEPDRPGGGERAEMVDGCGGSSRSIDSIPGDARGDEDRRDDREPRPALGARAAQRERDPQRDRRQRVAGVVDQVGEQRDLPEATKTTACAAAVSAEDEEREQRPLARPRASA